MEGDCKSEGVHTVGGGTHLRVGAGGCGRETGREPPRRKYLNLAALEQRRPAEAWTGLVGGGGRETDGGRRTRDNASSSLAPAVSVWHQIRQVGAKRLNELFNLIIYT